MVANSLRHARRNGARPRQSVAEDVVAQVLAERYEGEIRRRDRSVIRNPKGRSLELDFYLPEVGTAIEVQGPSHFIPMYGEATLARMQANDWLKRQLCARAGIRLLEVDASRFQATYSGREKAKFAEEVRQCLHL